jgi:hypothetical protein
MLTPMKAKVVTARPLSAHHEATVPPAGLHQAHVQPGA